jgi:ribonuclease HI
MEGLAIIHALKDARGAECEIRTDSLFWINVLTQWITGLEEEEFQECQELDIVTEIDRLYQKSPKCKLVHVRGHKGEPGNEMADEWANKAREGVRL